MENAKHSLFLSIRKIENDLQAEDNLKRKIRTRIVNSKRYALRIGEKVQNISWKVSQAEFINICESIRHNNYLDKIAKANRFVKNIYDNNTQQLQELLELKRNLILKLNELKKINNDKRTSLSHSELNFKRLQDTNGRVLAKLMNKIEKSESQERKLEDTLEQMQDDDEDESL